MRWLAVVMAIACILLILQDVSGCRFPKESVLSAYEGVVQFAGQFTLMPAIQLQGVRSFGEDHLEGNYTAHYENYSGTEYLFGDTSTHQAHCKCPVLFRRGKRRRQAISDVRLA